MTEAKNPLATAVGTYYPKDYVVAVVDDPAKATQALAAFAQAGCTDAVAQLCPGDQFLENYRDFAAHRSLLQRAADLFPAEERAAVEEYLTEAEQGASFVTVHVANGAELNLARDVLRTHGGHAMRHYGDYVITDL